MCSLIIALIAPYHADHLVICTDYLKWKFFIASHSRHLALINCTEITIVDTIQKSFHIRVQILLDLVLRFFITFYRDRRHLIGIGVFSFRIFRITAAFKILCGNLHFAGCRSLGLHLLLDRGLRSDVFLHTFLYALYRAAGHLWDQHGFLLTACSTGKQQSCKYCSQ